MTRIFSHISQLKRLKFWSIQSVIRSSVIQFRLLVLHYSYFLALKPRWNAHRIERTQVYSFCRHVNSFDSVLACDHFDQDLLCTQVDDLRFPRFATLRKSKHVCLAPLDDCWMTARAETNLYHWNEIFANLCALAGSFSFRLPNSNLYFKLASNWDSVLLASRYFCLDGLPIVLYLFWNSVFY